jgi:hypothetical protein
LFFTATFPCKNQSINQSMFPVTPIWSTGHPPPNFVFHCHLPLQG